PDFTLLDLRPGKPAQLNLFRDLDQYALKNLLIAGLNLGETGDVADHYRISEQKAAKLIAEQFPQGANIQQVLAAAYALPEALKKDVKGLITRLENVADLSVLQTDSGIDVAGSINGRRPPVRYRLDGRRGGDPCAKNAVCPLRANHHCAGRVPGVATRQRDAR
ncbi:hypothetical protein POY12_27630, partial [Klebsiella pneumoniae]